MNDPLVSINCLTFNHVKYIRLCLDSFIMQKTNFPFEILIHDDASTDGTQDIIMEYQQKFPEIIKPIYQTENQYSKNIDIGSFNYERVRGKYVANCEGDDYWTDENKLQIQVDFMESHPECSVCFHPVKLVWEDNSKPNYIYPSKEERFNKEILELKDLLKSNFIPANSVMYRWQFYGKNYKVFYPSDVLPMDWYWHLFHSKYGTIRFIDKCMSVYNKNAGGIWYGNIYLNHGVKMIKFYEAVYKNFASHNKLYLYLTIIPSIKQIYDIFKENNHRDGLNFIENNPNWTNVNRGISYLLLSIRSYKNKLTRLLKKCHSLLPIFGENI